MPSTSLIERPEFGLGPGCLAAPAIGLHWGYIWGLYGGYIGDIFGLYWECFLCHAYHDYRFSVVFGHCCKYALCE